jgi:hypothetical protein
VPKLAILALALAVPAAAAMADTNAPFDPNEILCRIVSVTGSRLGASRRCATRAQWIEEQRQQSTQLQERTQRQVNPQSMTPGERAVANGRVVSGSAGRGRN